MEISLQMKSAIGKNFPVMMTSCMARKSSVAPFQLNGTNKTNFYEILSLDSSKNVGPDEIKKAYRCKALKFHPDACPPAEKEESTRRFVEINMAYETLSDPVSREIYDYELGLWDSCGRPRLSGVNATNYDSVEEKRGFSRETWQRQLDELKKRSIRRMKIKKEKIRT